jgi:hypothetical protein
MATAKGQSLETLSVSELKNQLCKVWEKHRHTAERTMAPLLYFLRKKLKAQGKSGAGFGAWVEDNLDVSRRTADRWADAYAVSKGWKKPKKQNTPAFGQMSKSAKPNPDGKVTVPLSFVLEQDQGTRVRDHRGEFRSASDLLRSPKCCVCGSVRKGPWPTRRRRTIAWNDMTAMALRRARRARTVAVWRGWDIVWPASRDSQLVRTGDPRLCLGIFTRLKDCAGSPEPHPRVSRARLWIASM